MRFSRRQSLSVIPSPVPSPEKFIEPVKSDSGLTLEISLDVVVRAAVQNTGANGAAIALLDRGILTCRTRLGAMAPEVGLALNICSGITGACVRTAQVLNCDDTEKDERVDAEVCRSLGIRSIVVIPILVDGAVTGLLEVLSDRPRAFTVVHVHWLQKVAALVRILAYKHAILAPVAQSNVVPEVPAKVDASPELAALASIPEITSKDSPESTGIATFRDVIDRTAQTSNWDDICQRLVSQLQK